jgi:hypothetical protein
MPAKPLLPIPAALVLLLAWSATVPPPAGATATGYSGRAFGAKVDLLAPVLPIHLTFSDTGQLPSTGGVLNATLLSISLANTLSSQTVTAHTEGVGGVASSSAHVEQLVVLPGNAAQLTAEVVDAHSQAACSGVSGSSLIVGLVFGGTPIVVSGQPNQTVSIPGVATLVINEQIVEPNGLSITVNALHLTLLDGLTEVIISSAHSDVACVTPNKSATWGIVKQIYR